MTTTETLALNQLAATALRDRLARTNVVDVTKKGRTVCEFVGERSLAERQWDALCGVLTLTRKALS